ncbi:unnamed protein product [Arabis nemorensis]|uniref:nucleoside-diphosphate kinase n=1 Tax=Arabis nemorensis TaxID=586526 RepID=A0A565BFZ2_9BRAS|nr:unnamed protein product [Arabis nemorensis]
MGQTFILIKPDGVDRGLVGVIIRRFDRKGFTLKGLKMITVDRSFAEKHHQDLSANPLFSRLVDYLISGPVVAMIWEGTNVVSVGRKTIPTASDIGSNLIHVSDSLESAIKETALWFPDGPVKLHSDAAIPKARDIGRISVTGFDTGADIKSALREHFASCGKITDVYIQKKSRLAYIYFVGEGAVDKALKLNGSDVGGSKVCVEPYPFHDDNPVSVHVEGYATSLSDSEIETALRHLFSSCGKVLRVSIYKGSTSVTIRGFDAAEKAEELSGSNIGTHKVLVKAFTKPPRETVHDRRRRFIRPPRHTVHDHRGRGT